MRDLVNPNTTDKPVEITRDEVARLAKTGCGHCDGAGCIAYAPKAERGQLKANPKWSLCRCVGKHFLGRLDVQEFGGKLHWMPRGHVGAQFGVEPLPVRTASEDLPRVPRTRRYPKACGFGWRNEAGDVRRCTLAPHGTEIDHLDGPSGARVKHPVPSVEAAPRICDVNGCMATAVSVVKDEFVPGGEHVLCREHAGRMAEAVRLAEIDRAEAST